jgi:hypothetical protein
MRMHGCIRGVAVVFLLAGCTRTATEGEKGKATFSFSLCFAGNCTLGGNPMVAGGAKADITVALMPGAPALASVRSSDESVATFALGGQSGDVTVTSGNAGPADLILLDGGGSEIDRATVTVKNADTLTYTAGWTPAAGPTMLAGTSGTFHVTTRANNMGLVGSGAVKFTLSGVLQPASGVLLGDSVNFTASAAGAGMIAAECPSAMASVAVTVVGNAMLTEATVMPKQLTFDHTAKGTAVVDVHAGTTSVYVQACDWTSTPAGVTTAGTSGGTLDAAPAISYDFTGPAGSYTLACSVGGALALSLPVTIN